MKIVSKRVPFVSYRRTEPRQEPQRSLPDMYPGVRRVAFHAGNVIRDAASSIDRVGMRLQGSVAYRETCVLDLSCFFL